MRQLVTIAALASIAAICPPLAAQATIAGTWTTEFDIGIRNENGVEMSMGKRQATLTLALKGDSVLGTWQAAAAEGNPTPGPIHLKGTRLGAKATLVADAVERTVRVNDDERKVQMVTTYRVELKGNDLVGTSQNTATDGSLDGPERPFTAHRKG